MLLGIIKTRKLVQHSLFKKIACYMQEEEVIKGFPLQTQLRYICTNNTYDTNSNIFTFQMIYVVQLLSPEFIASTLILNNLVMKTVLCIVHNTKIIGNTIEYGVVSFLLHLLTHIHVLNELRIVYFCSFFSHEDCHSPTVVDSEVNQFIINDFSY